jgi:hypothetical protein
LCLEARGGVHDVAGRSVLDPGPSAHRPRHHQAGLDPDSNPEAGDVVVATDRLGVLGDPALDLQPCQDGTLGVVLVGDRGSEQCEDAVAGYVLHGPAELLDDLGHLSDGLADDLADVLRVEPLAERRRPGHVRGEGRDDPALLTHRTVESAHMREATLTGLKPGDRRR